MKTAIFDLDGTLADTLTDLADAVNYGLKRLGYPEHPYESYNYFVGNGVQRLCRSALPEDKKDEIEKSNLDANQFMEELEEALKSHEVSSEENGEDS